MMVFKPASKNNKICKTFRKAAVMVFKPENRDSAAENVQFYQQNQFNLFYLLNYHTSANRD